MLRFERLVVSELTTTSDPARREQVASFVEGALRSMPEHLRLAIGGASAGLGVLSLLAPARTTARSLDTSPVPQLRQYVRVFRSLVLFAEQELPVAPPAVLVAAPSSEAPPPGSPGRGDPPRGHGAPTFA